MLSENTDIQIVYYNSLSRRIGESFYSITEWSCIICLSSVSGTLTLNSIEQGFWTPFINPMSSNGAVESRVSWKAQRIRTKFMNTDL